MISNENVVGLRAYGKDTYLDGSTCKLGHGTSLPPLLASKISYDSGGAVSSVGPNPTNPISTNTQATIYDLRHSNDATDGDIIGVWHHKADEKKHSSGLTKYTVRYGE